MPKASQPGVGGLLTCLLPADKVWALGCAGPPFAKTQRTLAKAAVGQVVRQATTWTHRVSQEVLQRAADSGVEGRGVCDGSVGYEFEARLA